MSSMSTKLTASLHPASEDGVINLASSVCYHSPGKMDICMVLKFSISVKWKDIKIKFIGQGHK